MATEEQLTYNQNIGMYAANNPRMGQAFENISGRSISAFTFRLRKVGSPTGTITYEIWTLGTHAGAEDTATLLASKVQGNAADLTLNYVSYEVTLDTPLVVNQNIMMMVNITGGDASNKIEKPSNSTDVKGADTEYECRQSGGLWELYKAPQAQREGTYKYTYVQGESTTAPSVTTQAVTAIDKTTATGNGTVVSLGVPAATQHGHCWATFPNPTTAQPTTHTKTGGRTENGVPSATGAFTSSLTTLEPNKKYYVRAYITNSVGTSYSTLDAEFTTLADVPVVTTDLATKVAATTAQGNGSIDNNGGSAITQHGVCWKTQAQYDIDGDATTADSKTEEGATSVIGNFSSLMTGLTAETTYHYRAYAVNTTGTGYGADKTFTTHAIGAPIVTTQISTNVGATSATGNGTIVDTGGTSVTQYGHCWGTSYNPTTANSKTTKGAYSGTPPTYFTSEITGLTSGTAYYIRAYATNSFGTSYGDNDTINELAGELKGEIACLAELLVYTSKTGTQRKLLGVPF